MEETVQPFRTKEMFKWLVVSLYVEGFVKRQLKSPLHIHVPAKVFVSTFAYLISVVVIAREAYATGFQATPDCCSMTALILCELGKIG